MSTLSINAGAYVNGTRPKTKKALREALRDNPASVTFDGTAIYDRTTYTADDVRNNTSFTVVGPDPYTSRKWYATVYRAPTFGDVRVR